MKIRFVMQKAVSRLTLCGLIVGATMITQPAQAQKPDTVATVRRDLEALSHRADADVARKDAKACVRYLADDFQGQDIEGSVWNKKQAEVSLAKTFSIAKTILGHDEIKDIRLDHGKAIVLTKEHTVLGIVGKKTGKVHTLVFNGTWRNTWIKKNGTWQTWRQKQLTRDVIRDGVHVPNKVQPKNEKTTS